MANIEQINKSIVEEQDIPHAANALILQNVLSVPPTSIKKNNPQQPAPTTTHAGAPNTPPTTIPLPKSTKPLRAAIPAGTFTIPPQNQTLRKDYPYTDFIQQVVLKLLQNLVSVQDNIPFTILVLSTLRQLQYLRHKYFSQSHEPTTQKNKQHLLQVQKHLNQHLYSQQLLTMQAYHVLYRWSSILAMSLSREYLLLLLRGCENEQEYVQLRKEMRRYVRNQGKKEKELMGIYYRWFEEVVDQQRDKKVGRRVREEMRMQEKELEIKCWELEDKD